MQGKVQLSVSYLTLISQIRTLLTRENLINNSYLFKYIKPNLMMPLYALVEERKIAQITTDEQQIIQALEESGLARVQNGKEVFIIDYPTVKISTKQPEIFQEIEIVLKQHEKNYIFTDRNEKEYMNLTIFEEDHSFIDQLMPSLSKEVDFQKVNILEDMKAGTSRIKKLKQEQKNSNSYKNGGMQKYSMERPPQIFIRRAVDSEDEEDSPRQKYGNNKKKYKEVTKEKAPVRQQQQPLFNNDDFPSLS